LLIGPASKVVDKTITIELDDISDNGLVDKLERSGARLADLRPVIDDSPSSSGPDFEMTAVIDAATSGERKSPL
jgi:hypothetical protein